MSWAGILEWIKSFANGGEDAYSRIQHVGQTGSVLCPPDLEGVIVKERISFTLNGEAVALETDADRKLLWVLRTELEKTGTKYGCGSGFCGSCTVLVDGVPVRSCLADLDFVQGKDVMTIEGLAVGGELHPLQQ